MVMKGKINIGDIYDNRRISCGPVRYFKLVLAQTYDKVVEKITSTTDFFNETRKKNDLISVINIVIAPLLGTSAFSPIMQKDI